MRRPFQLTIVKRDGVLFEGRAEHIRLPGVDGLFGVLAHHVPIVAELTTGPIDVRPFGEKEDIRFSCTGGLVEVNRENSVTVLLDAGERSDQIDVERAQAAAERARQRLARARQDHSIDMARAQAALARALLRLRIARKADKQ